MAGDGPAATTGQPAAATAFVAAGPTPILAVGVGAPSQTEKQAARSKEGKAAVGERIMGLIAAAKAREANNTEPAGDPASLPLLVAADPAGSSYTHDERTAAAAIICETHAIPPRTRAPIAVDRLDRVVQYVERKASGVSSAGAQRQEDRADSGAFPTEPERNPTDPVTDGALTARTPGASQRTARLPMTVTPAEAARAAADLTTLFWEAKKKRVRVDGPAAMTRASGIGDSCERKLYYSRTVPAEDRVPHGPGLQTIFDLGNDMERIVIRELESEMNVEVVQRGRDYVDQELQVSGHVDVLIRLPGWPESLLAEIKGLNPMSAERVEVLADIRENKAAWIRKYFSQLQMYLYLAKKPAGIFILKNKSTGEIRFIDCPRDDAHIALLLERAGRVRDAVAAGEPLPRHAGVECGRCPFLAVCAPDMQYGPGVTVLNDEELLEILTERETVIEAHRRYEAIAKELKGRLPKAPEILVGDFVIRRAEVERKGYTVAQTKYWTTDIEKRGGA